MTCFCPTCTEAGAVHAGAALSDALWVVDQHCAAYFRLVRQRRHQTARGRAAKALLDAAIDAALAHQDAARRALSAWEPEGLLD